MAYLDHLKELRNRILYCFIFLFLTFLISFYYSEKITNLLSYPLYNLLEDRETKRMIFTGLPEVFVSYLKVSLFCSFLFSFPFFALQLSIFISPALYKKEKRFFGPIIFLIPLLFYMGVIFAYFILIPVIWEFFLNFENYGSSSLFSIQLESKFNEYMKLTMYLLFSSGLAFLFPILLIILSKFKIVTVENLKKNRKFYFIGILIFGAVFTPPDIISQIGIAIPLILFFELSIYLIKFINKK